MKFMNMEKSKPLGIVMIYLRVNFLKWCLKVSSIIKCPGRFFRAC